ncbi:hypothetical protein ALO59_200047 [Pseudomonas amygdali pv. mellea]|nr:hypothetical protein ALO59_200047 [Pseudomonas amygdali pv. mellea]
MQGALLWAAPLIPVVWALVTPIYLDKHFLPILQQYGKRSVKGLAVKGSSQQNV